MIAHIPFPHVFIITDPDPSAAWRNISKWINDSCVGQWMLLPTKSELLFYSPPTGTSPISGKIYPPSKICHMVDLMICFENEKDAVAFKLMFVDQ